MSQLENFLMELYTEVKQRNDFTHSINKIEVNKFSENHKYIQSLIPFSEISSIKFIAIFQEKSIRRSWHDEEWWFSVIDVIAVLSDSIKPRD